jgi:hypothetical protein
MNLFKQALTGDYDDDAPWRNAGTAYPLQQFQLLAFRGSCGLPA